MGGKTTDVGNPSDYQFLDPTGQFMGGLNAFQNRYGQLSDNPNAYMDQFMGQQGGLANIAQGASQQLGQSLNANAAESARLGGEAALAAMPGQRFSGAAQAAFGQAYAQPFAEAAAQRNAAQLGLTGQLWNQAMGQNAANYQQQLGISGQNYGSLAGQTGMVYQPTYQYQPGVWDRLIQASQLASSFMPR